MIRSPLIYLTLHAMRNRIAVRLRRIRQPRYLIASLLGSAYFFFIIAGQFGRDEAPGMLRAIARARDSAALGATAFLFGAAAIAWIWPTSGRAAMSFTQSEVQHLFTAPLARRRLLRYRLLRSQIGVLFGSAIVTLLLRPRSFAEAATVYLGITVLTATLGVYLAGVSLSRASQGPRRWIPKGIVATAVAIVGATIAMNWTELTSLAASGGGVAAEIDRLSRSGLTGIILWPFRMITGLPLSGTPGDFLVVLPWALLLLGVLYVWVIRTDVPFEEASAELSEKVHELRRRGPDALTRPRTGVRTPFRLTPHGRAETAILWKNLISMGRVLSWTTLVRVAPVLILLSLALSRGASDSATVLTFACLLLAGYTLLLGPHVTRSDLRQDLAHLGLLKTWPIRGAALLRGEMMAPAIVLTSLASLGFIAATVISPAGPFGDEISNRWNWLLAALLIAPGVVLAQLLAVNGLAVTFPSWITIGPRQGTDVFGQRLLVMLAVTVGLVIGLLPAMIVGGIGTGIVYGLTGAVWPVVFGMLAGATLLIEVWAGTEVIGALLDRTDLAAVDAPES